MSMGASEIMELQQEHIAELQAHIYRLNKIDEDRAMEVATLRSTLDDAMRRVAELQDETAKHESNYQAALKAVEPARAEIRRLRGIRDEQEQEIMSLKSCEESMLDVLNDAEHHVRNEWIRWQQAGNLPMAEQAEASLARVHAALAQSQPQPLAGGQS